MAHGTAESVAPMNSKSLKYLESKWQASTSLLGALGSKVAEVYLNWILKKCPEIQTKLNK